MIRDPPSQGSIVAYPYLWRRQHEAGETEGRKMRPACLVLAVRDEARGLIHLALLAITSQPPTAGQAALQIPDTEKRRAGLADWKSAWITVGEYNYDILERSFYLDVNSPPFGSFSAKFLGKVATSFKSTLKTTIGRVDRTKI
jgi:hypothetical protein